VIPVISIPTIEKARKRCPRYWARRPFDQTRNEDVEAHSNKITFFLSLLGVSEIIIGLLVIGIAVFIEII